MDKENEDTKISKCKYSFPVIEKDGCKRICKNEKCKGNKGGRKNVTKEDCESCVFYKSRYIEYPIEVNEIENKPIDNWSLGAKCGDLVEVRPCKEDKTYSGVYLGDLPIQIMTQYNEEKKVLTNSVMTNPAMFVPELKRIVYGCESWWRKVTEPRGAKDITDEDINGQFYVQMLNALSVPEETKEKVGRAADYLFGHPEELSEYIGVDMEGIDKEKVREFLEEMLYEDEKAVETYAKKGAAE